jgi:hypothetical protein
VANRPVKRRVIIVLENRDRNDSAGLLRAIADELRPNEVEIRVKDPNPVADPPSRPDEQLETRVREDVARAIDKQNQEARSAPTTAGPAAVFSKRERAFAWLGRLAAGGWRFTLKVLPVAERVAKIVKDLGG